MGAVVIVLVLVAGGNSPPPAGSDLTAGGAEPAQPKPRRLTASDRKEINATLDVFVNHAVKRDDVGASYAAVTPELRGGMSQAQWSRGSIPVYPYPAGGRQFHGWTVSYANSEEVGLELLLHPRPEKQSTLGPFMFKVYLKPVGDKWLVDSFMPAATFAPVEATKTKVRALPDFSPQPQTEKSVAGSGRINPVYVYVPFGVMGLLLLALAGWGIAAKVRDRRLAGPRGGGLPPLPPRFSRRSAG